MLDVDAIAQTISELPEEARDPEANIVEVIAVGGSNILRPMIAYDQRGRYPLRRAFRILQEIRKMEGGYNYCLR
jgi:hypothetical protein